ncbi:MAG: hypothetical protein NVS4B8_25300 [Herpetosiphon sp.]
MAAVFPDGRPAILATTVAAVRRQLPFDGELLVRAGNRVEPDDLVGRCKTNRPPLLLDIAGVLGIEPRELTRRLKVRVGVHVAFRDLLARKGRKTVLAPSNGTISDVDPQTGFVTLLPDAEPASVAAGVRGFVLAVEGQRSVTIETGAAVVQGRFGCGFEQWGILRLLVTDPGDIITAEMIDARSAFTLVIGGAGITADALRKAQAEQVKGVIVGSMLAAELREYLGPRWNGDWQQSFADGVFPMPSAEAPAVLLTEGFGVAPMSRPAFDLLSRFDRQDAFLQAQTRLGDEEQRPRLVIPLSRMPHGEVPVAQDEELRTGAIVRIDDETHRSLIGKVLVLTQRGRLPSGVRTATAVVQIGTDEQIMVPQSVLHVIE